MIINHFLKSDITFSQDLSEAALSFTTTIGRNFKVEQIIFHASQNITETITITLDSAQGANYDTRLRRKTLNAEQDYVWIPEGEVNFKSGDEIKIQCTNANKTGTIRGIVKPSAM